MKILITAAIALTIATTASAGIDEEICHHTANAIQLAAEMKVKGFSAYQIYSIVTDGNPTTDTQLLAEILNVAFDPDLSYMSPSELGSNFFKHCISEGL